MILVHLKKFEPRDQTINQNYNLFDFFNKLPTQMN
jgi:hypothetical protein